MLDKAAPTVKVIKPIKARNALTNTGFLYSFGMKNPFPVMIAMTIVIDIEMISVNRTTSNGFIPISLHPFLLRQMKVNCATEYILEQIIALQRLVLNGVSLLYG